MNTGPSDAFYYMQSSSWSTWKMEIDSFGVAASRISDHLQERSGKSKASISFVESASGENSLSENLERLTAKCIALLSDSTKALLLPLPDMTIIDARKQTKARHAL